MDKNDSAEQQLSAALNCLHLLVIEKSAATDELQANNLELRAVLDALLRVRGEMRQPV